MSWHDEFSEVVRDIYPYRDEIYLHEPWLGDLEKKYLNDCIDSTFVSSVGPFVNQFEQDICNLTGAPYCVAVVNGTQALFLALVTMGVSNNDIVVTTPLTFAATANAISYTGAEIAFVDIEWDTFGLDPKALEMFFFEQCTLNSQGLIHKTSGKRVRAVIPVHIFGYPCKINQITDLCKENQVYLVEDAAEAMGSYYQGKHLGCFGDMGVFSFNGNKIVTTGGGGALVMGNKDLYDRAKHLSSTSRVAHPYEVSHDQIGFNFRMPNLNAALGLAQLKRLPDILSRKLVVHDIYRDFFKNRQERLIEGASESSPNHWLNGLVFNSPEERKSFLEIMISKGIHPRAVWTLLHKLGIYKKAIVTDLSVADDVGERIVCLPSSPPVT